MAEDLADCRVGADLLDVRRLRRILEGPSAESFLGRTFTAREVADARTRGDRVDFLAGRFAAKEAVFKSLGVPCTREDDPRDIEVTTAPDGAPVVRLGGHLGVAASAHGVRAVSLSLSHDGDYVLAVALAVGARDRSRPETG